MRSIPLITMTIVICVGTHAAAQTPPDSPPPLPPSYLEEPRDNRQEYREEMHRIRTEHDAIRTERDRLQADCEHAPDTVKADCTARFETLNEKRKFLREHTKNLHAKMREERQHRKPRDQEPPHHGDHDEQHNPHAPEPR